MGTNSHIMEVSIMGITDRIRGSTNKAISKKATSKEVTSRGAISKGVIQANLNSSRTALNKATGNSSRVVSKATRMHRSRPR